MRIYKGFIVAVTVSGFLSARLVIRVTPSEELNMIVFGKIFIIFFFDKNKIRGKIWHKIYKKVQKVKPLKAKSLKVPENIGKTKTALLHSKNAFPHTKSEIMQSTSE